MKSIFPPQSELMTRKQAGEYLGVTEGTLAVWACTGRYELPVVKVGRLSKYRLCDLVAFIESNLSVAAAA